MTRLDLTASTIKNVPDPETQAARDDRRPYRIGERGSEYVTFDGIPMWMSDVRHIAVRASSDMTDVHIVAERVPLGGERGERVAVGLHLTPLDALAFAKHIIETVYRVSATRGDLSMTPREPEPTS